MLVALGRADSRGASMRLPSGASARIANGELRLPVQVSRPSSPSQAQLQRSSCLYVRVPIAWLARAMAFDAATQEPIASGRAMND